MKTVIIIGARIDGHAGVIKDCIESAGEYHIIGWLDTTVSLQGKQVGGIPVLGSSDEVGQRKFDADYFHIAIGDNIARGEIYDRLKKSGAMLLSVIHPRAFISEKANIGEGTFVGPMAVINHGSSMGPVCIINSGAIVEHDNHIGKAVHIGPGSSTSGRVVIDDFAFIGVGSTIIPDIHIGRGALVGAGSTVVKDVEAQTTIIGYAAKKHIKNIYSDTGNEQKD